MELLQYSQLGDRAGVKPSYVSCKQFRRESLLMPWGQSGFHDLQ